MMITKLLIKKVLRLELLILKLKTKIIIFLLIY
jgi:hypothetical protein